MFNDFNIDNDDNFNSAKNNKNNNENNKNDNNRRESVGPLAGILTQVEESKIDYNFNNKNNNKNKNNRTKRNSSFNTGSKTKYFNSDSSGIIYNTDNKFDNDIGDTDSNCDANSKSNFNIIREKVDKTINKKSTFNNIHELEKIHTTKERDYDCFDYNYYSPGPQINGRPESELNIMRLEGVEVIHEPEKLNDSKDIKNLELEMQEKYNKNATILDFDELPIIERLKYDYRSFCIYLKDMLFNEHILLSLFFRKSLFYPSYIRIIRTFTYIIVYIVIGSMMYTDDDISARNKLDLQPAVSLYYIYIIFTLILIRIL